MVLTTRQRNEAIRVGNFALSRGRSAASIIAGTDLNREQRALVKFVVGRGRLAELGQQQEQPGTIPRERGKFQGPVRPTTDVETFRETGRAVKIPRFQGPVRPTTDIQQFRETGKVVKVPKVEKTPKPPTRFRELEQQFRRKGFPVFASDIGGGVNLAAERFSDFTARRIRIRDSTIPIGRKETIGGRETRFFTKVLDRNTEDILLKSRNFNTGELALFVLVEPALATGLAAKGTKQILKKATKKKKKAKFESAKELKDEIKKLNPEDTKRWRDFHRNEIIKNPNISPAEKEQRLLNLDALLVEVRTGKSVILEDGSIDLNAVVNALKSSGKKVPIKTKKVIEAVVKDQPPTLKGIGAVSGATRTALERERQRIAGLPRGVGGEGKVTLTPRGAERERTEAVGFVGSLENSRNIVRQQESQLRQQLANQGLKISEINKQVSRQRISLLQKALQQQQTKQIQNQINRQIQRQREMQKSGLASAAALRLQQQSIQRLRQRLKQKAKPRIRGRLRPPRPKFRKPFVPFGLPTAREKKLKRIPTEITKKIPKFDVFTKKFGKKVRINKKPLRKKAGLDFGASRIAKTLRASFFLKKSNRKGLGKVKSANKGFFKKNQNQFRKSKVNPKIIVERRKHRLDSAQEKRKIQEFRRRKKRLKK